MYFKSHWFVAFSLCVVFLKKSAIISICKNKLVPAYQKYENIKILAIGNYVWVYLKIDWFSTFLEHFLALFSMCRNKFAHVHGNNSGQIPAGIWRDPFKFRDWPPRHRALCRWPGGHNGQPRVLYNLTFFWSRSPRVISRSYCRRIRLWWWFCWILPRPSMYDAA